MTLDGSYNDTTLHGLWHIFLKCFALLIVEQSYVQLKNQSQVIFMWF